MTGPRVLGALSAARLYSDDFRPKPAPACCPACAAGYHSDIDPLPPSTPCVCPCHAGGLAPCPES